MPHPRPPSGQVRKGTAGLGACAGYVCVCVCVRVIQDSRWAPSQPPTPAGPRPTPHVFWLVQCEVDLVDLSPGDGIWGNEEADSCNSKGQDLWLHIPSTL